MSEADRPGPQPGAAPKHAPDPAPDPAPGPAPGPAPDPASRPLAGLAVVELHAIGPVPFAGTTLASLGATVTRVSPPLDPALGVRGNARHDFLNDAKRTLRLDLKTPGGLASLHELLRDTDVLIEGFRPGVLERLGLAPAALLDRNPRLVIGRLSGFGARGGLAPRAGHDINYLAMAGVLHAIGTPERPVVPLNLIADFGGGAMHLVVGVLARLVQRGITGRGGVAESSILAGTVGLTPMFYGMIADGIWRLQRERNLLDGGVPFYRTYRTADERFVAVGALEAKFYRELLQVLGVAGQVDAAQQFDAATWPRTTALFSAAIAAATRAEWERRAADRDCCLTPVLDFAEAASHPHNQAMGLYALAPVMRPGQVIAFPD
ncbi:MAG TPA: CaiB/BaiF CoA-transferase family protein [Burkholderiaceae bacterium]